jgi:hypothetical protein
MFVWLDLKPDNVLWVNGTLKLARADSLPDGELARAATGQVEPDNEPSARCAPGARRCGLVCAL